MGIQRRGSPALRGDPPKSLSALAAGLALQAPKSACGQKCSRPDASSAAGRQELSVELGGMSLAPFGTASPSAYSGSRGALGDHRGPRYPGWVPTTCILVRPISDALEQGHNPQALMKGLVAWIGRLAARSGRYRRADPFQTPDNHCAIQSEPQKDRFPTEFARPISRGACPPSDFPWLAKAAV